MTRRQDVEYAACLGIDAVGLIFYAKSPRAISIEQAAEIVQAIPAFMDSVAVFVDPEPDFVEEVLQRVNIQLLQFHGREMPEFCLQFGKPYIKAISAHSSQFIKQAERQYHHAAGLLLDTPSTGVSGGSGKVFNWDVIPDNLSLPLILAGGLQPANVKQAIKTRKIHAVDVCSGVEASPGIKDHQKMLHFIENLGSIVN